MYRYLLFVACFISIYINPILGQNDNNIKLKKCYSIHIDFSNFYLSGICMVQLDNDVIVSSVVNEFALSTVTFQYEIRKDKIKIINIIKQLNNFYIKKIIKSDFKKIMKEYIIPYHNNQSKDYEYENIQYNINYKLIPLKNEIAQ